jgi:serine/threonine protein kinase
MGSGHRPSQVDQLSIASMQDNAETETLVVTPGSPGTRIGPYLILERLGCGGMGLVYRARDTRLGRDVALKVLSPELRGYAHLGRRFLQEAQAASALDHPNCCPVYDIGDAPDGSPYIAMAFCEGESLERHIERGPLGLGPAIAIARQVAEGLSAAHAKGIVHRDIKAANVILGPGGQVRIVDFGIAKIRGIDLTQTGMMVGTVSAMAPEQFGSHPVDERVDCWGLGVLLYQMLTAHKPFEGQSASELIGRILTEPPTPLSHWLAQAPAGVVRLIDVALSKDPAGRFQDMAEMARALSELELELARHSGAPPQGERKPAGRRTWRILGPGGLAFMGIAVLAAVLIAGRFWPSPPGPLPNDPTPDNRGAISASATDAGAGQGDPAGPGPAPEALGDSDPAQAGVEPSSLKAPITPTGARHADPSTGPGWTELSRAVWNGDSGTVKRLLASGDDPSLGAPPPLVAAVVAARPELARLLLAAGADPNAVDGEGVPALILAALAPDSIRIELVRSLLAMGAHSDKSRADDKDVESIARQQRDEDLVRLLRQGREDPNLLSTWRAEILAQVEREL